jgi:hypothetical protein
MGTALVIITAGPAFGQAQAPVTKAPPPARTPSMLTGPPTGLPKAGPPVTDQRTTIQPGTQMIDPRTGRPTTAAPNEPTTPPAVEGPRQPR